jgi:hypothetical protein
MKLRAYDNGGETFDRYTILDLDSPYSTPRINLCSEITPRSAIGASEHPFHPQGFGQHCAAMPGRHLGKRVAIKNLPPDVQKFVKQSF